MEVVRNGSLKKFNTFNVDEKARVLVEIDKVGDLLIMDLKFMKFLKWNY